MAEDNRKFGALSSSVDPSKLALTVKGLGVAVIPGILIAAKLFGWDDILTDESLRGLVDGVSTLLTAVGVVVSAGMVVWGMVRKILVGFGWYQNS